MSYVAKGGEKDYDQAGLPPAKSHRIRITLTSKNVKALEKGRVNVLLEANDGCFFFLGKAHLSQRF